jgi:hypothetical protein
MRVIIPPLTNQYLNLTKNSSLAVAIGYPDFVQIFTGTVLNQTGQAVEIVVLTRAKKPQQSKVVQPLQSVVQDLHVRMQRQHGRCQCGQVPVGAQKHADRADVDPTRPERVELALTAFGHGGPMTFGDNSRRSICTVTDRKFKLRQYDKGAARANPPVPSNGRALAIALRQTCWIIALVVRVCLAAVPIHS